MKKHLQKYFIPNNENEHQPHSLRDKSLSNILILSIFLEIIVLAIIFPVFNQKLNYLSAVLPGVLATETNQERQNHGLNTLESDDLLVEAAQMKANDMAEKGYFNHVTPENNQPWSFLEQVGYDYEFAGENLAVNFVDSKKVHQAWMDSSAHRENILKDKYTEIGIATAKGQYKGKEAVFVVQFFAKPKLIVEEINDENTLVTSRGMSSQQKSDESDQRDSQVAGATTPNDSGGSSSFMNSVIDRIMSMPITAISSVISVLMILISIALILKIFIKIKIQSTEMISNGIFVFSVLFSFYVLNSLLVNFFGEII